MKRKIINELKKWKENSRRKLLIVMGARQIGKTYSILQFGKSEYDNVIYINLEGNTVLQNIFTQDFDVKRIISEISLYTGESIFEEKTLIFIDEIQSCQAAITSLKYFMETANQYHVITAGSLLGVSLNRKEWSYPVGKVDVLKMFPLDFEEFLWALGQKQLSDTIRKHYANNTSFNLHDKCMDFYQQYLLLGGMPAVLRIFLEEKDYRFAFSEQASLVDAYIQDMAKYPGMVDWVKINAVYDSIPAQLGKENTKFQYAIIKSGARAHQYESSISWLFSSNIIIKCTKIETPFAPLSNYAQQSQFKIYYSDIGMLRAKMHITENMLKNEINNSATFKGILTENYVAIALNMLEIPLYYWEKNSQYEVDFLLQAENGSIIPIEVKSARRTTSKSLNAYIKSYTPEYAIRISGKNFGFEDGIRSVPLYAVFCMGDVVV